jgi:two-component system, chemotaxis family, response regulator Rcp1
MNRILLVEDSPQDAELISLAFQEACGNEEVSLQVASNGEDALKILRGRSKPQLLLLDLNLPRMSGLEILKEIRQDPDQQLRILPVLILTTSKSNLDVLKAYNHLCNAFIQKPIDYDKLRKVLTKTRDFWFDCVTLPSLNNTLPPPSSRSR